MLYDNVPGGAGLVAQLESESVFDKVLRNAKQRVEGNCRLRFELLRVPSQLPQQFSHPYLDRNRVLDILNPESRDMD